MKVLATIMLRGSQGGSGRIDPITSGLSRMAVRGRPFLSEHDHDNRFRYYKGVIRRCDSIGGLRFANPPLTSRWFATARA
jgi:hypothetical protein